MDKISFEDELQRKGVIVYRNSGTSMLPLIRQNRDLVIIEKCKDKKTKKYDVLLYKRDDKYILHRVMKVKKDGYVMCGDTTFKKEYGVGDDSVVGILSAVVRDGKTLKVTDKKYRFYVHLRCDLFFIRFAWLFVKEKAHKIKAKIKGDK